MKIKTKTSIVPPKQEFKSSDKLNEESILLWKVLVVDPRFLNLIDMMRDNCIFKSGTISDSNHGQIYIGGFREGFSHYETKLLTAPDSTQDVVSTESIAQIQDEDLSDQ